MQRVGMGVSKAGRWTWTGAGAGSVVVGLLLLAAPLAGANYVSASWAGIATTSAAGATFGSGVNTPTAGQPTAALVGGAVHVTFGFTSTSGAAVGQATYQQTARAGATPTFLAWKAPGSTYTESVLFGFQMAANDVLASVNCLGGGSASASAVIFMQIGIYDVTTGTWAAALGPAGPPSIGAIVQWMPYSVSCGPGGSGSVGNPALSLPALGNLTGPTPLTLTAGNVYQVEGLIGAYGFASTTAAGATASAVVGFPPGDFVEPAYTTVY